jgi:hypothetical protein
LREGSTIARYGDLGTQYFDDAGDPLVSGKVYFYETGTTTLKATYSDVDYTIANTNPVILTAAGRQPNIFFEGVAKAILATSAGTQILVRDPVGDTAESFGNPWISSKRYSANDVVQGSDGQYYVSLINGNVNLNPVTTTGNWTFLYSVEWNAGTTYKEGSVITYQSLVYQSLQNTNLNKNPLTETTFWTAIQLSWISTVTYALNANVVASNGVLYTSIQAANTGNAPATSPLWWVGTSAAAAASASAALASQVAAAASAVAAAASASTATTQASNASTSASTATTQASNASASAVSSAASAVTSAASASASSVSAAASLASQLAAAASAAAALASENAAELAEANATGIVYGGGYSTTPVASNVPIADTSGTLENWVNPSINKRTNPLARAVQVSITAATSASNGIQQLTNVQNNFATGNFALQWRGSVPDWTPAANVILITKHDGTNGYILTLLTTGFLRLTINATNFDSTVVTGITDNYVCVIDVDITAATTTAAGSVVFTLNGVQLGTTLVISARVEKIVNGTFDTDLTGWTLAGGSGGTQTWTSGKNRVERVTSNTGSYQAISLVAGETFFASCSCDFVSGAGSTDGRLSLNTSTTVVTGAVATAENSNGTSGTLRISYYVPTTGTYYLHLSTVGANGVYDFDTVTSLDSATVDNTSSLYVCGTSAVRSAAQWLSHRLFNRAKTVAENLGMFVNGMAAADVGASQTAITTANGDFETWSSATNPSSWLEGANVSASVSQVTGGDQYAGTYSMQFTTSGTPASSFNNTIYQSGYFSSANVGKTVRFKIALKRVSGTGDFYFGQGGSAYSTISGASITTSWQVFTVEKIITDVAGNAASLVMAGAGNAFVVDDYSVTPIGITSELLAQNAQADNGQVLDSSGNKQHALLPAAGASIMGAISARRREVRWTNTWAGTNELQYIGGVNQALLPANAYIESIVGTVSGATPHDIIVGDGSDTDRYVTITTGLATGTNTFTVANRTTDATNLKLTVTPDTAATMSIAWVITYYRLEG